MFICYSNSVSPHQLPLARELVKKLEVENYRFVATNQLTAGRVACGWTEVNEPWIAYGEYGKDAALDAELETCEVLLTGIRELELFEKRARKGLKTFYQCERWFKPISIGVGQRCRCSVPGWLKMLVPSYRKMAKRFVRWIQNDPNGRVLAIGPWAKKDMLRLDVPESKIIPWGYFVAPSAQQSNNRTIEQSNNLKMLWVGRMVALKRVDTIIRALREVKIKGVAERWSVQLTLVGDGPEKPRLQHLAARMLKKINTSTLHLRSTPISITFLPSQPIEKIRSIMREHDILVFTSNGRDGWGAVVSEALEEGLKVLGTCETGASATMLPREDLFHVGDWKTLAVKLEACARQKVSGQLHGQGIGDWSAAKAAERLLKEWVG